MSGPANAAAEASFKELTSEEPEPRDCRDDSEPDRHLQETFDRPQDRPSHRQKADYHDHRGQPGVRRSRPYKRVWDLISDAGWQAFDDILGDLISDPFENFLTDVIGKRIDNVLWQRIDVCRFVRLSKLRHDCIFASPPSSVVPWPLQPR